MDTPLAATVHKKGLHVGGGKTFTMRKPIRLKLAGKKRKALADFRNTYAPSSGVSNDVNLKPMAHGKQQRAGADLFTTKKQIANRASKVANLNTPSVSLGYYKASDYGLTDEELKECLEWDSDECVCSTLALPDEWDSFYSSPGIPRKELSMSDDKGHEIEDPNLHRPITPMSFPGPNIHLKIHFLMQLWISALYQN